ncbi:MAG: uracil-DNA glycosylase family protein [Patescibacteria group bacterium]
MQDLKFINTLEELWTYTYNLHKQHYPSSNLEPIMSGGKHIKPKYMFVFINPTYRNISSNSSWQGKRRPWTGTKYIWKIFNNAGHFDSSLLAEINSKKEWDIPFADKVYKHLEDREFYFTNIVKWTGENADLPTAHMTNLFLPILLKEIELVQPKYIVTFGLIPFNALINEKIKLADYYDAVIEQGVLTSFPLTIGTFSCSVIPSYFPVGRGNPKRATKILNMLP